ncbi:hypothetical protein IJ182_06410 [bacterium]|nr:hypothetical protein [bacterium]
MSVSFRSNVLDSFTTISAQSANNPPVKKNDEIPKKPELNTDVFKTNKKGEPKVGVLRIWFHRLKQDQIDAINESGKLPKNIKIRPKEVGTGYYMYHNIFNMFNGTKTMPEGWELRRNILGFTRLVPKDTEGFWLRKKPVKAE